MSISTILRRLTVKPMTENGCPFGSHETIPAAPFTSAARAEWASREKVSACSATARAPRSSLDAPAGNGTAVGSDHDVWIENREKRVQVTAARRCEEGVYDLSLRGGIGVGDAGCSLHPAASAARELSRRGWGAFHDRSDLVEGHGEHVMQHEREPLGRTQCFEYHEQRETDRVGQQCLLHRVDRVCPADDRVGHVTSRGSSHRTCASATCPGTPARRLSSAIRQGSRRD